MHTSLIIAAVVLVGIVIIFALVYITRKRGGENQLGPQPEPPDQPKH